MKYYVEKEVPARTELVIDRVTCDLCGNEIRREWYKTSDVDMKSREGMNYPESSWGTETSFDVCGTCFNDTVVPFMVSKGAVPTKTDWDY